MPSEATTGAAAGRSAAVWLEAGLAALVRHGATALTLERLCAAVGKSRGSFYHHFSDHDAFVAAMVTRWKERQTEALIQEARAQPGLRETAELLDQRTTGIDHGLDMAMRRFAAESPVAAAAVAQVDALRVGFLEEIYRQAEPGDAAWSRRLAQIDYALFVGWQTMWPDQEMPDWAEVQAVLDSRARL